MVPADLNPRGSPHNNDGAMGEHTSHEELRDDIPNPRLFLVLGAPSPSPAHRRTFGRVIRATEVAFIA